MYADLLNLQSHLMSPDQHLDRNDVAAAPTEPVVTAEAEPVVPLSPLKVFWYNIASLGCGTFFSFNNFILPLFLEKYTKNAVILGLMGSTHSVEGAIIQPVVGTLSDRMRSPLGRRRPFMLLFFP